MANNDYKSQKGQYRRSTQSSRQGEPAKRMSSEYTRKSAGSDRNQNRDAAYERRRRERIRQERLRKKRIKTGIIAAIAVVVIVVVIILIVSGKKGSGNNQGGSENTDTAVTTTAAISKDEIPTEYIEPTMTRDEVEISSELPVTPSDSNFSVKVNVAYNIVTVYKKDASGNEEPIKAMACSTAREGYETTLGTYTLGEWYDWCYMADGTWGQYAYRIIDNVNNDLMFHSVPYLEQSKSSLEYEDYNKLGDVASMGCVRLSIADTRWLCSNVGFGSEVVIYKDESTPGPLEKPEPMFLPEDITQVRGWDPTDSDPENPWHEYKITFKVENSVSVAKDGTVDWTKLCTAKDNYENDLSKYVKSSETIDTSQAGITKTTLTLDIGPIHASKDVYVIVE